MSARAVVIGLLMGALLAIATHFNDAVIRQTMLIGNYLPVGIFGTLIVLLLLVNPASGIVGRRLQLRPRELAVAAAIGLAACAWPGSNFYRTFATIVASPHRQLQVESAWQSQEVLAYVPGASSRIAPGHVRDFAALRRALAEPAADSPIKRLRQAMPPAVEPLLQAQSLSADQQNQLLHQINIALSKVDLTAGSNHDDPVATRQRNRQLLTDQYPQMFLPAPSGEGVILPESPQTARALDHLLMGRTAVGRPPGLLGRPDLSVWWPSLRLWVGAAALLGICSLAMALVVHQQWTSHELLPYPIVKLVDQCAVAQPGRRWPAIAYEKLFWLGFGAMVFLHLVNGLHAWFAMLPEIQMQMQFQPLIRLFPNAAKVPGGWGYFAPTIIPTVVAFSFFIARPVSFSLGVAPLALMLLGTALISQGMTLNSEYFGAAKSNMLRLGAYLAMALMIFYVGRGWYWQIVRRAIGLGGGKAGRTMPGYVPWAARIGALAAVGLVWVLAQGGLPVVWAIAFVGLVLVMVLVLSRIVAETGMFFIQPVWLPAAVLTGLFGFEAIGPTAYIILGVASIMLVGDPREALMPFLVNALGIVDRRGSDSRQGPRAVPWIALMVLLSLGLAGVATVGIQHGQGLNTVDRWATTQLPSMPFTNLARHTAELRAAGTLADTVQMSPMQRLGQIEVDPTVWFWTIVGGALVLGCAVARLRFAWWPLHPVLFLVWGTTPIAHFAASFLLGWAITSGVIMTAGARGHHRVRPLMVGIIAGELTLALVWTGIGATYYFATGLSPRSYAIFPG